MARIGGLMHPVSYRGTSLIRKRTALGPYSRTMPRVLGGPRGVSFLLWARYPCTSLIRSRGVRLLVSDVQGYLAHKKAPPALGPDSRPVPGALWWS